MIECVATPNRRIDRTRIRREFIGRYAKAFGQSIRAAILFGLVGLMSGCGAGVLCLPCAIANDPRETADQAVADWMEANDETDVCRADAMQHCLGASLLAGDCGVPCALFAGRVLEAVQNDRDPMDDHNNEAGAQCDGSDTEQAVSCCDGKLNDGELRTDGNCR